MDFLFSRPWKAYFPKYHFPRFLRVTCGCLALILTGTGVFVFLVAPSVISYIVTLDRSPILEVSTGATVSLGEYGLHLVRVENHTHCLEDAVCDPVGSAELTFSTTVYRNEYVVMYMEDTGFSDPVSLPLDYLMRVISVSPNIPNENYTVQLEIFKPSSNRRGTDKTDNAMNN